MTNSVDNNIQPVDFRIFIITLILIGIGVAFMYGASAPSAESLSLNPAFFFDRHLVYGILAVFIILIVSRINPHVFFKLANILLILTLISLVLVLIPGVGKMANGARRWIDLKFFNFQPSELAKITILIYISKQIFQKGDQIKSFTRGLLPLLTVIGITFILIFVEEDFSTAMIILASSLILLFTAGASFKHFLFLLLTCTPILYFFVTRSTHMKDRLLNYVKKFYDPSFVHFHEKKSINAIQDAHIFGNGFGLGSYHAKIPYSYNDYYFSAIVSDVGLIGGLIIISLFIYLFVKNFKLAYNLNDKRLAYLTFGMTLVLAIQTIINLGSVLGLLPITGLPLPFLSYGGNSLISCAIAIGIILSISRYKNVEE